MIRLTKIINEIDKYYVRPSADNDEVSFTNDDRTYIRGDKGQDLSDYNPMPKTRRTDHLSHMADSNIKDRDIGESVNEGFLSTINRAKGYDDLEYAYSIHDFIQNELYKKLDNYRNRHEFYDLILAYFEELERLIKQAGHAVEEAQKNGMSKKIVNLAQSSLKSLLPQATRYLNVAKEKIEMGDDSSTNFNLSGGDNILFNTHTVLDNISNWYNNHPKSESKINEGFLRKDQRATPSNEELEYAYKLHDYLEEDLVLRIWNAYHTQRTELEYQLLKKLAEESYHFISQVDKAIEATQKDFPKDRNALESLRNKLKQQKDNVKRFESELTPGNVGPLSLSNFDIVLSKLHFMLDDASDLYRKRAGEKAKKELINAVKSGKRRMPPNWRGKNMNEGFMEKRERPTKLPEELKYAYKLHDHIKDNLTRTVEYYGNKDSRPFENYISAVQSLAKQTVEAYKEGVKNKVVGPTTFKNMEGQIQNRLSILSEIRKELKTQVFYPDLFFEADDELYQLHSALDTLARKYQKKRKKSVKKESLDPDEVRFKDNKRMNNYGDSRLTKHAEWMNIQPSNRMGNSFDFDEALDPQSADIPMEQEKERRQMREVAEFDFRKLLDRFGWKLAGKESHQQTFVNDKYPGSKLYIEFGKSNDPAEFIFQRRWNWTDTSEKDGFRVIQSGYSIEDRGDMSALQQLLVKLDRQSGRLKEDAPNLDAVEPWDDADIEYEKHHNDDIKGLPKDPDSVNFKMDPRVKRIGYGGLQGKYARMPRTAGGFDNIAGGDEKPLGIGDAQGDD